MRIDRQFPFDVAKIGGDALLGIALAYLFFQPFNSPWESFIFVGAIGGILPDPLQFVYWKFRHEPIATLQRFHVWIHAKTDFDDNAPLGIALQAILVIAALFLGKMLTAGM